MTHPNGDLHPRDEALIIEAVSAPPKDFLVQLEGDITDAGGELAPDPDREGAIGATMFDLPTSEDGSVTVLLPQENIACAPSQALLRIKSRDGRRYLGIVSAGPFAEPDSLRGDSNMLITVTTRGGIYLPPYHGRVQAGLLGEEIEDQDGEWSLRPQRLRPLPNSPVHALSEAESAAVLGCTGDITLGLVDGYEHLEIQVPSDAKTVLPRHTAILGTTGGGKSTTVSLLTAQAQAAGMSVILLDVEGEYTFMHEPTDDRRMLSALRRRGGEGQGLPADQTALYHLVGRDTANPEHPHRHEYSLQFARISPYALVEILGMNEAQSDRYLFAYDVAKDVLREIGIFPDRGAPPEEQARQERMLVELDEFERGYPRLTLTLMLDFVGACLATVQKTDFEPYNDVLRTEGARAALQRAIHGSGSKPRVPENANSWKKVLSFLWRLRRIGVFDRTEKDKGPIAYGRLLRPGMVSIFDLSDSGMSELSNIVIAELLRGVQEAQDQKYEAFENARKENPHAEVQPPPRVLIIIEEAHQFLGAERIEKMEVLFKQVATIAKRGRKRWLGLIFVTQLPQHLPRQVFGLVNSYILHKITDPQVVRELQRTVSGIDEGLWKRLPGLAPGQAIVSFPHMTHPLLVAVDPTPVKLRMID